MKFPVLYTVIFFILFLNFSPSFSFTTFVFGDSLVDAGNNDYIFTLSKANLPPYGIDFQPSGGQPTGRFTNGRTISDIVGQYLGAESFPPPFLAPTTEGDKIFSGVNYASGASGILDETGSFFLGMIPLREQVRNFEESRRKMVKEKGEKETNEILKNAIFSLTIGSNDILNYIQPSIPFLHQNKPSPSDYLDFMISNLTIQLKRLQEMGARKLVVVGVGPLGCIPFVRTLQLIPSGKCSLQLNKFIQRYNFRLTTAISQLNLQFGPHSLFLYANSYRIFMHLILNHRSFGFSNANQPCCGGAFPPFICYKSGDAKISSSLCEDRSKYVFWDAYHPTEAANIIVAKALLDGGEAFCSPVNIRQLYAYTS